MNEAQLIRQSDQRQEPVDGVANAGRTKVPAEGPTNNVRILADPDQLVQEFARTHDESQIAVFADLSQWWAGTAVEEIARTVPKVAEYGSGDLIDVGRTLAQVAGRRVTDEEAAEIGVYFYVVGKLSRWTDAVRRGVRPSDDTLFDLGVYIRMAQRIRASGGWPGKPDQESTSDRLEC